VCVAASVREAFNNEQLHVRSLCGCGGIWRMDDQKPAHAEQHSMPLKLEFIFSRCANNNYVMRLGLRSWQDNDYQDEVPLQKQLEEKPKIY